MALKTDYKDDILDVSQNTKRKYTMIENQDGTVSFDDETVYSQEGDSFGASDINAITEAVNSNSGMPVGTIATFDGTTLPSGFEPYQTEEQRAIAQINDNLTTLETDLSKHTVNNSDRIEIPYNTEYIAPSDGYARVSTSSGSNYSAVLNINDSTLLRVSDSVNGGMGAIFVRKGSKITYSGSSSSTTSGYFYPLS